VQQRVDRVTWSGSLIHGYAKIALGFPAGGPNSAPSHSLWTQREASEALHLSLPSQYNVGNAVGAGALAFTLCISECNAEDAQQSDFDASFLSRVTIEEPLYTRHLPTDKGFDDHNWGAFVNVDMTKLSAIGNGELSVIGGDFTNSYYKNTAILAGAITWTTTFSNLRIDAGPVVGIDLNAGYQGHNNLDPLLGAVQVRVGGTDFGPEQELLNHLGVAVTLIPGTVINLALAVRL